MARIPHVPRLSALMFLVGAGSVLLGLPYLFHAFGPTEAEVAQWGLVSIYAGLVLWPLGLAMWRDGGSLTRVVAVPVHCVVAFLQIPPAFLWFAFHGSGISDGTPPSDFVAHWAFALPHVVLLALSGVVVFWLLVDLIAALRRPGS